MSRPEEGLPEYELEVRVIGAGFEREHFAIRVDGKLHVVYRYFKPGMLWLLPIEESGLEYLEGEEMDGLDTDEFGVARYDGPKGALIKRSGQLVKPQWAKDLKTWTPDALFDDEEIDDVKKAGGL